MTNYLVEFLKKAERSEAKSAKREAKHRDKNQNLRFFDAKLRFALFASLRSAIFRNSTNLLVIFLERVKIE